MRIRVMALAFALASALPAQRQQPNINTETPEGQLLQQIGQEEDAAKKLALMEQFITQYPKHDSNAWVYAQMVPAYAKANQFDKALEAGDKLITADPEDARSAHEILKTAEASKNPDAVKAWAVRTSEVARKVMSSPKAEDEEEEDWKARVDYAKQVDTYTEYSLYAAALQTPDPRKKIELAETLEQRNAQSQYLWQLAEFQFLAYLQAGEAAKAIALAEKVLAKEQTNEQMLLAVAGHYRSLKQNPDKVLAYCAKVMELAKSKAKPEGVSDADWEKRTTQLVGRANFISGAQQFAQSQWATADQTLRAALPGIQDDQMMTAEALFYLGVANYRMGEGGDTDRIKEALAFSQKCGAVKTPYQVPCNNNVRAIRARYRVQ